MTRTSTPSPTAKRAAGRCKAAGGSGEDPLRAERPTPFGGSRPLRPPPLQGKALSGRASGNKNPLVPQAHIEFREAKYIEREAYIEFREAEYIDCSPRPQAYLNPRAAPRFPK